MKADPLTSVKLFDYFGFNPHLDCNIIKDPEPEARGSSWEKPAMPKARAGSREEQPEERWLSRHRRA